MPAVSSNPAVVKRAFSLVQGWNIHLNFSSSPSVYSYAHNVNVDNISNTILISNSSIIGNTELIIVLIGSSIHFKSKQYAYP